MPRLSVPIGIAIAGGVVATLLLPPSWLGPLSAGVAICCALFAFIIGVNTKTEPHSNRVARIFMLLANLPEQPLARVNEGWALSMFVASAAFLVSLGISVMVLANA